MLRNLIYHLKLIKSQILSEPLNKGHKIRLVLDYTKWIILHKHRNKAWIITFENGFRSIVKPYPDHDSGSMNIWTKNVDYNDILFIRSILKLGDTIIDAGCNVGNRTLALADIIGGAILIDANKKAIARTKENLVLNDLPLTNFILIHKALGDKQDVITFSDIGGASTNNRVVTTISENQRSVAVEMTTIDVIVSAYDYKPAFLKIDIEGYDLLALRGALKTLTSGTLKLVKFEILDSHVFSEFNQFFQGIGWTIFALDNGANPTIKENILKSQLNLFASPTALANIYLNR